MNFFLKHLLSDKIREKTEVSWGSSENFCKNYRKTSVSKYLFNKVKTHRHSCFLVTFAKKRTTFLLRSSRRLVLKTGLCSTYFLFSIVVVWVTVTLVSLTLATNKYYLNYKRYLTHYTTDI